MKSLFWAVGLAALGVFVMACSSAAPAPAQEAPPAADDTISLRPDERPLIEGPLSADGTRAIFATSDLGVGKNRVGFVLTGESGLVRLPAAAVSSYYLASEGDTTGEMRQTALATFRNWPYGTRGLYTTDMTFDNPGRWRLDIGVIDIDTGESRRAELFFEVMERPETPAVGDPAIRSDTPTLSDVESIEQLTTGTLNDPELYHVSLADAVQSGKPTVVVMASPAFCTNAVCGPQVDVLRDLKDAYKGQANFIHVDFYANPHEIQGDLSRAVLSPTVVEWKLPSIEWTFVIDREGVVGARFESFATFDEVEEALKEAL